MKNTKHIHEYTTQKSGIKTCPCGRFQHKEGGEAIVEQRQSKHTPTPWKISKYQDSLRTRIDGKANDYKVADTVYPDDASFIVRACNSYEALVNALSTIRKHAHEATPLLYEACFGLIVLTADEALKQAKGE